MKTPIKQFTLFADVKLYFSLASTALFGSRKIKLSHGKEVRKLALPLGTM